MFVHLKQYLEVTEEFFQNEIESLQSISKNHLIRFGYSGSELYSSDISILEALCRPENDEHFYWLVTFESRFLNILRRSLFVTAYSTFEHFLMDLCEYAKNKFQLNLSVKDFPGNGIRKARDYLVNVGNFEVPSGKVWQEILAYNKLRNCVVHNGSELEKCTHAKFLTSYVSHHPHLSIEEDGEVWFDRGFCEEALENFDIFVKEIKW